MSINLKNLSLLLIVSAVIGLGLSYSKLYAFHIVLAIHMIFTITSNKFNVSLPKHSLKEFHFLIFTFFWYLFTVLWSIKMEYTFRYLFYLFCGIYIVYVIVNNSNSEDEFKKIVKWASIFFIVEMFVCLLEIFTPFRMPVSPLSEHLEMFGRSVTSRLYLVSSTPTGFRWNPNDLAVTMVIIMPFFMFLKNKFYRFLGTATIMFIVLMTSSRGAFISMAFGLIAFPLLYAREKIVKYTMWASFLSIILVANIDYFKNHENRQVREISESYDILEAFLFGESKESETSIGIRKKLMKNGFQALDETFWLGVGGGGSVAIHELIGGVGEHQVASMHNFWLEIIVEAGIIFGLLFIFWYIHLTVRIFSAYRSFKSEFLRYVSKATTLAFVIFPFAAISSSSTIYLLPMWMLFGFAMAILNLVAEKNLTYSSM